MWQTLVIFTKVNGDIGDIVYFHECHKNTEPKSGNLFNRLYYMPCYLRIEKCILFSVSPKFLHDFPSFVVKNNSKPSDFGNVSKFWSFGHNYFLKISDMSRPVHNLFIGQILSGHNVSFKVLNSFWLIIKHLLQLI